jgi:hypothetical protein
MDYWAVYKLPIPVRKWLIHKHNKQVEQQNNDNQPSTDRPLTRAERMKMIKNAQKASNNNNSMSKYLDPRRNKEK